MDISHYDMEQFYKKMTMWDLLKDYFFGGKGIESQFLGFCKDIFALFNKVDLKIFSNICIIANNKSRNKQNNPHNNIDIYYR